MPVTYHVLVVFDRDEEGSLKPGRGAGGDERRRRGAQGQQSAFRPTCRGRRIYPNRRSGDGRL
jgi:hypothetical protein